MLCRTIIRCLAALAFVVAPAFGTPPASTPAEKAPPLADRVASLVSGYQALCAKENVKPILSISIVPIGGGKPLYGHNEDALLSPASNQKVLTSAFALTRLGEKFEFVTQACMVGKDLWIIGSGDPTFGDAKLASESNATAYDEVDRWAAAIKQALPGGIEGDIVACTAFSDKQTQPQESYRHADWPPKQAHDWFCAPVAAVNFNNNCIDLTFVAEGDKIVPILHPASKYIAVTDKIVKGGEQTWGALIGPDDASITLKGTVKAASADAQNVAINEPPLFAARVLAGRLDKAGVKLSDDLRFRTAGPEELHKVTLPKPLCQTATPLGNVIRRANKHSLNMAAECVFLRAGDGTWAGSAKLMTDTLVKEFGLDAAGFDVHEGSGLSKNDKLSAAAMTKLLAGLAQRPYVKTFLASLPIAGTDGTMEHRLKEAPYKGRVLAKTGWIAGVSCLSGYVLDKDGVPAAAFSILCNKVPAPAKEFQDNICRAILDSLAK